MSLRLYGSSEPLPIQTPLHAGPIAMVLENGALRYLRLGGQEVIRTIYFALRDQNWGTVPYRLEPGPERVGADSFSVFFDAVHAVGEQDVFRWRVSLTGEASGTVRFTLAGTCLQPFSRNRAGFCVLHPIAECAGKPVRLMQPDGTEADYVFPKRIAPHRPFPLLRAMRWSPVAGVTATVTFEGDDFETEDHRNWTDTSYKTFCTPLEQPYPVALQPGDRVEQVVTLSFEGLPEATPAGPIDAPLTLTVASQPYVLPRLGTLQPLGDGRLTHADGACLRQLGLRHYRADLRLFDADWTAHYQRAAHEAGRLSLPLWLGLTFSDKAVDEARQFAIVCRQHVAPVDALLLFTKEAYATQTGMLQAVVSRLRQAFPAVRFGAGTQTNYAELSRNVFEADGLDLIAYGIQPQEHAFDLASLVENIESQADSVASARALYPNQSIAVSPLTLRKRYNPYAKHIPDRWVEQPAAVQADPRQHSLFGAGWLLGSLATLAAAGASDVTVFRAKGPDGLLTDAGSPAPAAQLLMWLAQWPEAQVRPVTVSDKLAVSALHVEQGGQVRWLLANHTGQLVRVVLPNPSASSAWQSLSGEAVLVKEGVVQLLPFEVAYGL